MTSTAKQTSRPADSAFMAILIPASLIASLDLLAEQDPFKSRSRFDRLKARFSKDSNFRMVRMSLNDYNCYFRKDDAGAYAGIVEQGTPE